MGATELQIGRHVAVEPAQTIHADLLCKVDDALKEWIYPHKFELIHMRDLYGSFSEKQWKGVYKQAYKCVCFPLFSDRILTCCK